MFYAVILIQLYLTIGLNSPYLRLTSSPYKDKVPLTNNKVKKMLKQARNIYLITRVTSQILHIIKILSINKTLSLSLSCAG